MGRHGVKGFIVATLFSTALSLVFALAIIHFSPLTKILLTHGQYVPLREIKDLDYYEQILISRMVKEKTLITVDALWSMQVSFYQTIVSVLIALNAAILAIAFFIIRASSKAEAIKEAVEQFDQFSRSGEFTDLVKRKAKKEISKINSTYGDLWDQLEGVSSRLKTMDDAIMTISQRVAMLDRTDDAEEDGKITE